MSCHPADEENDASSVTHDISLYCDDICKTIVESKAKEAKFKGEVEDHGYGFVTHFYVPGNFYVQVYQPKY